MPDLSTDKTVTRESPVPAVAALPVRPSTHFGQHAVLALQRAAGNRAVGQLLLANTDAAPPMLQRKPVDAGESATAQQTEAEAPTSREAGMESSAPTFIVDDDAPRLQPGQMRKSEFLAQLRTATCAAADEALRGTIYSSMGCPYIERWFSHYAEQSSLHVERALHKYAPETARAHSAREYIPIATDRVRQGVAKWARTGEVSGVPPEMAQGVMPGATFQGLAGAALSGIGSAIGGAASAIGGAIGGAAKSIGKALFKERAGGATDDADPQAIQAQLSSGHPLDENVRTRMETAFGADFSSVRIHRDGSAAGLSESLNARAFTVGTDIGFGAGEYQPGTLIGDALLAHELAHVVQQREGSTLAQTKRTADYGALEEDADVSAVGAVAATWEGAQGALRDIGRNATPRLRAGLRLQRCDGKKTAAKAEEKNFPDPGFTKVVGHGASADAVKLATQRMNEIFSSLKSPSEGELKGATVELHIIPKDKKLTDLSEFERLKGVPTFDGRKYDDLRGVGGIKSGDTIRYAIAEEQLVPIPGKPSGYATGFVAAHESGHIVQQFGLTDQQKKDLKDAFDARTRAGGPWLRPAWYTSSNTDEYFAQSASAYFGHPYTESEEDKSTYTREWVEKNDPAMYKLLTEVFK